MDVIQNNKHNAFVNKNGAMHSRNRWRRLSGMDNCASLAGLKRTFSNIKPINGVTKIPPN